MSTTTITGTIHGVNNTALANKWINFRLAQLGTDAVASVTVAESVDSVQTDASGNFSIDVWNNGDSGTTSLLEIAVEGSDTQYVVMPKDVASIELWDLIENYQAEGNTSQVPVVSDLFLRKSTNLGDVPNKLLASQNLNLAIGTNVQAHNSVLDNTTASFTLAEESKLSGIEELADKTSSANITAAGGYVSGGTDVAIVDGGTGASDATTARSNLGAQERSTILDNTTASFTTANENKLDGIEALADVTDATSIAASGGYVAGGTDVALTDGGTGASDALTARTNLGVAIGTNVQEHSAILDATTASFTTEDEDKLDGIEALADVTNSTNILAAGGYITGTTVVPIADGGTGATTAEGARLNLGLSGEGSLSAANNLSDVSSVSLSRNNLEVASADQTLLKSENLSGITSQLLARQNLGLTINTDVQQYSEVLDNTTESFTALEKNAIATNSLKVGITAAQASAIVGNSDKVSNATHTGDVTGSSELTIEDDTVTVAKISATGTPTAQSFLSGAGVWAVPAGTGSDGDMQSSTYDPLAVQGNAFDMANMVESVNEKILTPTERNAIVANTAKVGITSTQANAIVANTTKLTNATHTGDVTGSGQLTIEPNVVGIANLSATGTPSATTFLNGNNEWSVPAGSGSGDMLASTYDPNTVAGDAFLMDNMTEGTNSKILTSSERTAITDNTAKVGITTVQADAIVANTAKIPDASTTGTPSATTFLRGDNQWATPAGGGGGGDVATDAIWNASGDLAVGAGVDSAAVLPIGGPETVLKVGATGAEWGKVGAFELSATGPTNALHFLRGDNTWAYIGTPREGYIEVRAIDCETRPWEYANNVNYFIRHDIPTYQRPWHDIVLGKSTSKPQANCWFTMKQGIGGFFQPNNGMANSDEINPTGGAIDFSRDIEVQSNVYYKNWGSGNTNKQQDRAWMVVGRKTTNFGGSDLTDKGFGIRLSGQGVFVYANELGSNASFSQKFLGNPWAFLDPTGQGNTENNYQASFRMTLRDGFIQVFFNDVNMGGMFGGPTTMGDDDAGLYSQECYMSELAGAQERYAGFSFGNTKIYQELYQAGT